MTKHPDKALTPVRINALKAKGRFADGNGLYLIVDDNGSKRWMLRTVVNGRRRDIGLGGLRVVTLAEAREKALKLRGLAREGGDPLAVRREAKKVVPTFEAASRQVYKEHCGAWSNGKHKQQWIRTLENFAFPHIGNRRIDQIGTTDVLNILLPIWLTRPETARRVRQRLTTVFAWSRIKGFRSGENPVDGITTALPRQPDIVEHFEAMPYADVPDFLRKLQTSTSGELTKLAFEFLVLTTSRTKEVRLARRSEIDEENALWNRPRENMKAKRPHRVPLTDRTLEILKRARQLAGDSEFIFPADNLKTALSDGTFRMILRRMDLTYDPHGFRSSFKDWARERTNFSTELTEAALAHVEKDKTKAAYERSDLLERRRDVMAAWEQFLASEPAEVIKLRPIATTRV